MGNPVSFVDPNGLYIEDFCIAEITATVTWCAANPACRAGITAIVGAGIYAQNNQASSNSQASGLTSVQQKAQDYSNYKDICKQQTPPGLDKCDEAKWKKNKAQQCYDARDQYTNKWFNGIYHPGHAQQMSQLIREIQKADKDIQRYCKCP
jgi:hypothetical protein